MATPPLTPGSSEELDHPEFATERLGLDVETATDRICETQKGLVPTETDVGVTFRTTDGRLVAVLTVPDESDPAVELHYRTGPPSATATLKARRLWRALEQHAE